MLGHQRKEKMVDATGLEPVAEVLEMLVKQADAKFRE